MARRIFLAPIALLLIAVLWFFRTREPVEESGIPTDVGSDSAASSDDDTTMGEDDARARADALREAVLAARRARLAGRAEADPEGARDDRSAEGALGDHPEGARGGATAEGATEVRDLGSREPAPSDGESEGGYLEATYIREAIRDLQPLLRECHELASAGLTPGSPPLEGRLVVRFVVGGEPDVGGVVEESEILDTSDVRHPLLEECFVETLYTVELPAPERGGRVTVHYPFVLSSREGPDPASPAGSAAPR